MLTLIRNVDLYTPQHLGRQSILLCGDKIAKIAPAITIETDLINVIDVEGAIAIPGLIDQHVHITGGGGENGLLSRIEPLPVSDCLEAGITTIVGLLGTDSATKSVHSLVAYTKAMNESGMTAYCLTGSYAYPSPTITGSVENDIIYIQEIIGVKLAISDHRSSYPTKEEILRLSSEARKGGLISNKAGITHFHVGKEKKGLMDILEIVKTTDFPISCFKPTHMGNQLANAYEFAALGGSVDFTTGRDPEAVARQIQEVLAIIPPEQITISSDANGSLPIWDDQRTLIGIRKAEISTLLGSLQALVKKEKLPLEKALVFFTRNVAKGLKLFPSKGCIKAGSDADIIIMNSALKPQMVFAKGELLLQIN
jgi:beta-aspartyl-dipeptidase (metallo-type)